MDDEEAKNCKESRTVTMGCDIGPLIQTGVKEHDFEEAQAPILLLPPSTTPAAATAAVPRKKKYGEPVSTSIAEEDSIQARDHSVVYRIYGAGLGNLGNTCFMNSTLQCLAHTRPLQEYFLSGEYRVDLNRDNPLGTGGDLATQFAILLAEMWGTNLGATSSARRRSSSAHSHSSMIDAPSDLSNAKTDITTSTIVHPRNFKITLGRHAEQFMGYDQHDSQELATYLLDALHEDTNRVTKKPYVERPEQGENESDKDAASKAWQLHLKREDSRILESFMGQVKSRVQCCEEDCGRVSTTFDPFMYLSVPIPGSSDRTLKVTFVPLDPQRRPQNVRVTLSKMASIKDLTAKMRDQLVQTSFIGEGNNGDKTKNGCEALLPLDDLAVVDIWQKEVYSWRDYDSDIELIRDNDDTVVYQLFPLHQVQKLQEEAKLREESNDSMIAMNIDNSTDDEDAIAFKILANQTRQKKFHLDVPTLTRINQGEEWSNEIVKYLRNSTNFLHLFNPRNHATAERIQFYHRFCDFIDLCHKNADEQASTDDISTHATTQSDDIDADSAGQKKRARSGSIHNLPLINPDEGPLQNLLKISNESKFFSGVSSRHDVAILEFLAAKMRKEILRMEREGVVPRTTTNNVTSSLDAEEGAVMFQVRLRKMASATASLPTPAASVSFAPNNKDSNLTAPLVLRVPSNTTVFGLRIVLAQRLARVISAQSKIGQETPSTSIPSSSFESAWTEQKGQTVATGAHAIEPAPKMNGNHDSNDFANAVEDFPLSVIRRIPLSYVRKSSTYRSYGSSNSSKQLGSLEKSAAAHAAANISSTVDNHDDEDNSDFNDPYGLSPKSRPKKVLSSKNNFVEACSTDKNEQDLISDVVGENGTVYMDWPAELADNFFSLTEYETVEELDDFIDGGDRYNGGSTNNKKVTRRTPAIDKKLVTVLDCIDKYCQMEQLEESEMWYCNRCKKHVQAWKQFHLYRAPPILIIHLKRFQYSATTHRRDKISVSVDFPLTGLDLSDYFMHWKEQQQHKQGASGMQQKPIYDLYAVSNHYGGLGGGHYTAYCLNENGIWCHYDDSRITSHVDPKEVVSDAAYVLYYRRKDIGQNESLLDALRRTVVMTSDIDEPKTAPVLIHQDPLDLDNTGDKVVGGGDGGITSDEMSSNAAIIGEDGEEQAGMMDVDYGHSHNLAENNSRGNRSSPMPSVETDDESDEPLQPQNDNIPGDSSAPTRHNSSSHRGRWRQGGSNGRLPLQ